MAKLIIFSNRLIKQSAAIGSTKTMLTYINIIHLIIKKWTHIDELDKVSVLHIPED
jgi:hypothetical protein